VARPGADDGRGANRLNGGGRISSGSPMIEYLLIAVVALSGGSLVWRSVARRRAERRSLEGYVAGLSKLGEISRGRASGRRRREASAGAELADSPGVGASTSPEPRSVVPEAGIPTIRPRAVPGAPRPSLVVRPPQPAERRSGADGLPSGWPRPVPQRTPLPGRQTSRVPSSTGPSGPEARGGRPAGDRPVPRRPPDVVVDALGRPDRPLVRDLRAERTEDDADGVARRTDVEPADSGVSPAERPSPGGGVSGGDRASERVGAGPAGSGESVEAVRPLEVMSPEGPVTERLDLAELVRRRPPGDGPIGEEPPGVSHPRRGESVAATGGSSAVGVARGSVGRPGRLPSLRRGPGRGGPARRTTSGGRRPAARRALGAGTAGVVVAAGVALALLVGRHELGGGTSLRPVGSSGRTSSGAGRATQSGSRGSTSAGTGTKSSGGKAGERTKSTRASRRAVSPTTTTTAPLVVPVGASQGGAAYVVARSSFSVTVAVSGGPCWLEERSSASGPVLWQGTLTAGQVRQFSASGGLWLRLGDAVNATVRVDGDPVRFDAGGPGQPYNLSFSTGTAAAAT